MIAVVAGLIISQRPVSAPSRHRMLVVTEDFIDDDRLMRSVWERRI
jgi:hypothetical protein